MQGKRYLESNEYKGTPFKAKKFASSVIKKDNVCISQDCQAAIKH